MTVPLLGEEVGERISKHLPQAVLGAEKQYLLIDRQHLKEVMKFLKEEPGLEFDYLSNLTSVDYIEYFEVIYNLVSLKHNHMLTVKSRCPREDAWVPSVVFLWKGAELQEREIYDLMGIRFVGHPNLKRLFLWDGFEGHPLRKDYKCPWLQNK